MASHLFRSACFGVQKGETLVSTTPLSYHYQSMRHVNRPKFKTNTIIRCILNSVNFVYRSRVRRGCRRRHRRNLPLVLLADLSPPKHQSNQTPSEPTMPLHPVFKAGNTALITGAASGIGLAVAKLCHKHGMKLALVDRNTETLAQAHAEFNNAPNVRTYSMDVSKLDEWTDLRVKVEMDFGQVQFLMLNAGIGLKSGWEDVEYFHKVCTHPLPLAPKSEYPIKSILTKFLSL